MGLLRKLRRARARESRRASYRIEPLEPRVLLSGDPLSTLPGVPSWIEQGPGPIVSPTGPGGSDVQFTGAIQAVAAHPTDPDVIYVGSVNGGIWKTTNATHPFNDNDDDSNGIVDDETVEWAPLTDEFPSLAISSLALSPLGGGDVIFAGTGETSSGAQGGEGVGVLRSTDAGATWELLRSIELDNSRIESIVPTEIATADGQRVLASTSLGVGILVSNDSGRTWAPAQVDDVGDGEGDRAVSQNFAATELVADPSNPMRFFAALARPFPVRVAAATLDSGDPAPSGFFESITLRFPDDGVGTLEAWDATDGELRWRHDRGPVPGPGATVTLFRRDDSGEGEGDEVELARWTLTAPSVETLYGGIYRSTDGGLTWRAVVDGIRLHGDGDGEDNDGDGASDEGGEGIANVVRFRLAASLTGVLYAGTVEGVRGKDPFGRDTTAERLSGLFRLEPGATVWTPIAVPTSGESATGNGEDDDADGEVDEAGERFGLHPGGQGDRHFSIVVDLNDPDVLYVGGDSQPVVGPGNEVGCTSFAFGRIFRWDGSPRDRSAPAWTPIVCNGASGTAPHADSRNMVFSAGGSFLLEVDDGGIFRLSDPAAPTRRWDSLNGNLALAEFYSVAWDPVHDIAIGGTQDNGVVLQLATVNGPEDGREWRKILGGDGGLVQVIVESGATAYLYSAQFLGDLTRLTLRGTGSGSEPVDLRVRDAGGNLFAVERRLRDGPTLQFVQPWALNRVRPDRLLIGTRFLYESIDAGDTLRRLPALTTNRDDRVGAIAYGGRDGTVDVAEVAWVSVDSQLFLRAPGGGGFQRVSAYGGGDFPIADIALDPENWRRAYVLTGDGRVLVTGDAGRSWDELSADLPARIERVAGTAQSIAVVVAGGHRFVFVGALGGVFRTIDPGPGGTPLWTEFGSGLPNVLVTDLRYDAGDDVLIAGTFGRGAWKLPSVRDSIADPAVLPIGGGPGDDEITIARDRANPERLLVSRSGSGTPLTTTAYQLSTIGRIEVVTGAGDDRLTIDYGGGIIAPPGGILFESGGQTGDVLQLLRGEQRLSRVFLGEDVARVRGGGLESVVRFPDLDPGLLIEDLGSPRENVLASTGIGIEDAIAQLGRAGLFGDELPVLGSSLEAVLAGVRYEERGQVSDPSNAAISAPVIERLSGEFLRRIFEEGTGGFALSEIGDGIGDVAALVTRLDALDAVPENVSVVETPDSVRFDLRVRKTLEGTADLGISALGETLRLDGRMQVAADVDLHLVFGVDRQGFFIDAEGNPDPEIVVRNPRVVGDVEGSGRIGFLAVDVTEGALEVLDPDLRLEVNLHDPGTGVDDDGLIRLAELGPGVEGLFSSNLDGSEAQDLRFTGTFAVGALLPGAEAPLDLGVDLRVQLTWIDVGNLADVHVVAAPGSAGQKLLDFLSVTGQEVVSGLTAFSSWLTEIADEDVLGTRIPLIDRSLGDILGGFADAFELDDVEISAVSEVFEEDGFRKFEVVAPGVNFLAAGVAAGNQVFYQDERGERVAGTIDFATVGELRVRYEATSTRAAPHATEPGFEIFRPGSLANQLTAFLGDLSSPDVLAFDVPTLQDLILELARRTGVEALERIEVVDEGGDLAIVIPLVLDPDPLSFRQTLDFGDSLGPLRFGSAGELTLAVDPRFQLRVGVRLGADIPFEERIFLAPAGGGEAEVALAVSAQLDGSSDPGQLGEIATGAIGFLDVALAEEDPTSAGITLTGTLGLRLLDPGTQDGRIALAELHPEDLGDLFDIDLDLALDIDPLRLGANVGSSSLAALRISLDGETAGRVTSLAELEALPARIVDGIEGDLGAFLAFDELTPQAILAALDALVEMLRSVGAGGVVDTQLPLVNRSLADLVDLGGQLVELGANEESVATASSLESFLEGALGLRPDELDVIVNDDDVRFRFDYELFHVDEEIPLAFALPDGLGLLSVTGSGELRVGVDARIEGLTVGFRTRDETGGGLDLAERLFLASGAALVVEAGANAGYRREDGVLIDPLLFEASVGIFRKAVVARALVDATLTATILEGDEADGRLTLAEIQRNLGAFDTRILAGGFEGQAQAIVEIDGDGDGSTGDVSGPSAADARIEVAGRLANLGNVAFESDPGPADDPIDHTSHTDLADPILMTDLDETRFLVASHNLGGLIENGIFDFGTLLDGIEQFIAWGQDLLGIDLLDFEIPILGRSLSDAFDFLGGEGGEGRETLKSLVGGLRDEGVEGAASGPSALAMREAAKVVRDALRDLPGVRVIGDGDGDGTVEAAPASGDDLLRLERGDSTTVVPITGATLEVDSGTGTFVVTGGTDFLVRGEGAAFGDAVTYNGGAASGHVIAARNDALVVLMDDPSVLPEDADSGAGGIQADLELATREIVGASFLLEFAPSLSTELFGSGLDLGLDFLDVSSTNASLAFDGRLTLRLGFGLTRDAGFFVWTDFEDLDASSDAGFQPVADAPEFQLEGRVEVDGSAALRIGFLELTADFDEEGTEAEDDFLSLTFGADLRSTGGAGRLPLASLLDSRSFDVDLSLDVAAGLVTDLSIGAGSGLPQLGATLDFAWGRFDPTTGAVPAPELGLEDIRLHLGDFLEQAVRPLFEEIEARNPLGPFLDTLTQPLPILGLTPLEILREVPGAEGLDTLAFLLEIAARIDGVIGSAAQGDFFIEFGDIGVVEEDGRAVSRPVEGASSEGGQVDPDGDGTPEDATSDPDVPGSGLPFGIGDFLSDTLAPYVTFPVLRLSTLSQLLLGGDVDLVFVDFPRFEAGKTFSQSFPLFSYGIPFLAEVAVEAFVGGGFAVFAELTAGFDTRGFRSGNFLDGIWLGDFDPGSNGVIDPGDEDRLEAGLEASIFAGIEARATALGFDIAKITGQGAIGARIGVDFNDDNEGVEEPGDTRLSDDRNDGRLHFDEIETIVASHAGNPLCLFDLRGQLFAELALTVKIDLLLVELRLATKKEWILLDLEAGCEVHEVAPDLAYLKGGDTLVLTSVASSRDADRGTRAGTHHPEGDEVQILLVDKDTDPDGVRETLRVKKDGFSEDFGPGESDEHYLASVAEITLVTDTDPDRGDLAELAGMGDGPDSVFLDPALTARVELHGGRGDDVLTGGLGGGTLVGGPGVDALTFATGLDQPATLVGGAGNDLLQTGSADDRIVGDYDAVLDPRPDSADAAEGIDVISAGGGNDIVWGDNRGSGPGADSEDGPAADELRAPNDVINAGAGSDTVFAGAGDDRVEADPSSTEGSPGDDLVLGGPGNDTLLGRAGRDTLVGGPGDDRLEGGAGDDRLFGGNQEVGPDASGLGNDVLAGHEGSDLLDGSDSTSVTSRAGPGDDTLLGSRGADHLFGEDGRDFIVAGPGNDRVEGGAGDDDVVGGKGSAGGVEFAVGIGGDDGADTLDGGAGDDVLLGDNGTIDPSTRAASTDPAGGAGVDTVFGGSGDDVLFGGGRGDRLVGDAAGASGRDVVVGDQGFVSASEIAARTSSVVGSSGDDRLFGSGGDDTLLGGDGDDEIAGDAGADILIGDNGRVLLSGGQVLRVESTDPDAGGDDRLSGSAGADILIGGAGADDLSGGADDAGADILLGDNGAVVGPDGSPDANDVLSTDPAFGGSDTLAGGPGDDILVGGSLSDRLLGGPGRDVLFGDHATLVRDAFESLERIETRFAGQGGADEISGEEGADIAIGGADGDRISGGAERDLLLGDSAEITLASGLVTRIRTRDLVESTGGADEIFGDEGDDVVVGGVAGDTLAGGADDDVLLGDNADLQVDDADGDPATRDLRYVRIESIDPTLGGADAISGGEDDDIALGASGGDVIAGDAGNDILLGDHGTLDFAFDGDTDLDTLDRIVSTFLGEGGSDSLSGGAGEDVGIGGSAGDTLFGDAATPGDSDGRDVLLGDSGEVRLRAVGPDDLSGTDAVVVFGGAFATLRTTDELAATGGEDTLAGNAGDDILAGGVAGDSLHGNGGDDILLGDNGRLEWGYVGDPAFADLEAGFVFDASLATLDLVTTELPAAHPGGRDVLFGDAGRDLAFGGTDADTIWGDDGDAIGADAGAGDILFGDHGRVYPQHSALPGVASRNFFAIDTGDEEGGAGDQLFGEEGDDLLLGQQGDDRLLGGTGDDDLVGGHNVAGGIDELSDPAVNDVLDGGTGDDVLAGDNAAIWRRADPADPRFRALAGELLYHPFDPGDGLPDGLPAVTAEPQRDPNGAVGRDIALLDHASELEGLLGARPFGNDILAGGADADRIFGELGNDAIQGDGSIDLDVRGIGHSVEDLDGPGSDGDDYVEGGGGDDLIFGNLGQDDLIGGSSNLFSLSDPDEVRDRALRPDGSDTIFGGAGTDVARNDPGDTGSEGHARDADMILGDNGNLFRILTPGGGFEHFVYDESFGAPGDANFEERGSLRIIPRAAEWLDYTPGGIDFDATSQANDRGAADVLHGESGDDAIYGMVGPDVLFGEGQDDDLVGGYGPDWISGGTGRDGILGDDGRIRTSRVDTRAEPLYGVAAFAPGALDLAISSPHHDAAINVRGELKKTAELEPFHISPAGAEDTLFEPLDADDILYGGLGGDWIHGGSGDDAISGAEALPEYYAEPWNPGDVLGHGRTRLGEFDAYDENSPRTKILVNDLGQFTTPDDPSAREFLLNFDRAEGPVDPRSTGDATFPGGRQTDGDDRLFGDYGNDWIVGGTGRDHLYGGWGDDLLNADDDHDSTQGAADPRANDVPDPDFTYEDIAFGGAGRDVLIANTGGDRLIDWNDEFNSYLVPFSPFGISTISRAAQPQVVRFLYDLSASDGADPTRAAAPGDARNGEPFGELGLVTTVDAAWQDQHGAPADPQPGNGSGSRDVRISSGLATPTTGTFAVTSGNPVPAPKPLHGKLGGDGVKPRGFRIVRDAFRAPRALAMQGLIRFDVTVQVDGAEAFQARHFAEAVGGIVFDYHGPDRFKFVALREDTNELVVGRYTLVGGFEIDAAASFAFAPGARLALDVSISGMAVSVRVDGRTILGHSFGSFVDDGAVGLLALDGLPPEEPEDCYAIRVLAERESGGAAAADYAITEIALGGAGA